MARWHGVEAPCHRCERANECPLIRKDRTRPRKGHSQAGAAEGGYVRSWKGCNPGKGTHLWRPQRKDTSGHRERATSRGEPTSGGPQREGPVRKGKGCRTLTFGAAEGGVLGIGKGRVNPAGSG